MPLLHRFIIALGYLDKFGIASINKVCGAVAEESVYIETSKDLFVFIRDLIVRGAISRVRLPSIEEIEEAEEKAVNTMERSACLGIHTVSCYDVDFPKMLCTTVGEDGKPSVPVLLYYMGDLSITERPALAVIGTRAPDSYGVKAGHYYAEAFARIGVNIVSGLAIGCDTQGHRGALDGGGVTTAILAHGLDSVYPHENAGLAQEIVEKGGLLLSEYPIGTRVNRYNLVARDRLQAGLADATLVIQTGIKGGTMHAVRATKAAQKPLFVVEYTRSTHEKVLGNEYLKGEGAIGLNAAKFSAKRIQAEPELMISMLRGKAVKVKISDKKDESYTGGLLPLDV